MWSFTKLQRIREATTCPFKGRNVESDKSLIMGWKEIQAKYKHLQADGMSEQEAAEKMKNEIDAFAKECVEHPEKAVDAIPEISQVGQTNPVLFDLLFFLFFRPRGGWGW